MTNDEIDWTHFTFQHGFRQLPQQASLAGLAAPGTVGTYAPHVTDGSQAGTPSDPELLPVEPKPEPAEHAEHAMLGFNHKTGRHAAVKQPPAETGFEPSKSSHRHAVASFGPAAIGRAGHDTQQVNPQAAATAIYGALPNAGNHSNPAQSSVPDLKHPGNAAAFTAGGQRAELRQEAEEDVYDGTGVDAEGEGEGENEGGSDEEGPEGPRVTRSRKSTAAELYMLDHGSQLVPKKVSLQVQSQQLRRCLMGFIC